MEAKGQTVREPVECGVGSFDIEIGSCLTGPTKRLLKDLHETARQCVIIKNAMARLWLRWHEDNPNYEPRQRTSWGEPKVNKDGKPVMEVAWLPQHVQKMMYDHGADIFPSVYVRIIKSSLFKELVGDLGRKMPYNHPGKAKIRAEAILMHESQLTEFSGEQIPIPNGTMAICYDGHSSHSVSNGIDSKMFAMGRSSCVVCFPLFSKKSGRENTTIICRLNVGALSAGHRELIRKVATREWGTGDSKLIFKRGKWFLSLIYKQPTQNLGLDPERTAELVMTGPDSRRAFAIYNDDCTWRIGDTDMLRKEFERIDNRRKAIRSRYREIGGGHGKNRFFSKLRPMSRSVQDLQARFTWNMVKEIVRFCAKVNCGKLSYREPKIPLRDESWFSRNDVPFDWTQFLGKLKHKCKHFGIELIVDSMATSEYRDRFRDQKPVRNPRFPKKTGIASMQYLPGANKKSGKVKRGVPC